MVGKLQTASTNQSTNSLDQTGTTESHPPKSDAVLDQVEKLLQVGKPRQALDLLARIKVHSPRIRNAIGVCQLRLGQPHRAVTVFRNLVLSRNLCLRPDVPTEWKVNFATALLMADNLRGCSQLVDDIDEQHHPRVQRLRAALQRWHDQLSTWEKIRWLLGGQPARPVELDFLPGDL